MDTSSSSEVVQYLKEISNHTESKPSYYLTVSGKSSTIKTDFIPPLIFPKQCQYEIACCGVETYFSFPNIDDDDNKIKVKIGEKWEQFAIPKGCYEIKAINTTIKRMIKGKGGNEKNFCLTPNKNTLQSVLTLTEMAVDFKGDTGSLRKVLGFNEKIYEVKKGSARFESESIVNILRVNSILVHCDVVNLSRRIGSAAPIIYNFFPNVTPGSKIVNRPRNLIYLPLTLDVISHMTSWLTDQNGEELDLRGEELTLTYHIKAC